MFITINPNSPTPLFEQIHDAIIDAIIEGRIHNGQRLNSVRRVATDFELNPATVQKAYDQLKSDGIIITENRSGSIVHLAQEPSADSVDKLNADLRRILRRALAQGCSAEHIYAAVDEVLAESSHSGSDKPPEHC